AAASSVAGDILLTGLHRPADLRDRLRLRVLRRDFLRAEARCRSVAAGAGRPAGRFCDLRLHAAVRLQQGPAALLAAAGGTDAAPAGNHLQLLPEPDERDLTG